MGDIRNKIAKIAEAERVRRAGARWTARYGSWRSGPKEDRGPCFCRGCGLTDEETTLRGYSDPRLSKRHLNGLWCIACMPTEVKMEWIDIMVTQGIRYDAEEHGDSQ